MIAAIGDQRRFILEDSLDSTIAALSAFQPAAVVHLAGKVLSEQGGANVESLVRSNVALGAYILEAMRICGCDKLINTGSAWQHCESPLYQPVNLYAATKQAFEDIAAYYAEAAAFRILHLHLFDTFGERDPRGKILGLLEQSAVSGRVLPMTPGEQLVYPVHIDDVCGAYLRALELLADLKPGESRCYAVRALQGLSVRQLVELFNAAAPERPALVDFGGRPYRVREVMVPWIGMPVLDGWRPSKPLGEVLPSMRRRVEA